MSVEAKIKPKPVAGKGKTIFWGKIPAKDKATEPAAAPIPDDCRLRCALFTQCDAYTMLTLQHASKSKTSSRPPRLPRRWAYNTHLLIC